MAIEVTQQCLGNKSSKIKIEQQTMKFKKTRNYIPSKIRIAIRNPQ